MTENAADLFKAADKMRGGLELSEYKHVAVQTVLGQAEALLKYGETDTGNI